MREVSDAFLLNMAEVSAALIGLFMVGVFFFVDTGFRRLDQARGIVEPYFRASTRIVLVLYALPPGPLAQPGRAAADLEPGAVRAAEPAAAGRQPGHRR